MAPTAHASDAALNWGAISHEVSDDGRTITLRHNHSAGDRWQLVGPAPFTYKVYSSKNPVTVSCPGAGGDLEVERPDDMHWIKVFDTDAKGGWKQLAELDFYLTCPQITVEPPPPSPPPLPPPPTPPTPPTPPPPVVPPTSNTSPLPPEINRSVKIGKVGPRSSRPGTSQRYRLVVINTGDVDQKVLVTDRIPLMSYPVATGLMPNGLLVKRNGEVSWKGTLAPGERKILQFRVRFHAPSTTRCVWVNNMFRVVGPGLGKQRSGFVRTRVCHRIKQRVSLRVTG